MSTFVSVGNAIQPFPRLLNAVRGAIDILPRPIVIQRGNTSFEMSGTKLVDFLGMEEFEELIEASEIVILHCGAGSIIHALNKGKSPIVMPRKNKYNEHIDDHQVEMAIALSNMSRIQVFNDSDSLSRCVNEVSSKRNTIYSDPDVMSNKMSRMVGEVLREYSIKLDRNL